ncbi:MLP-like protein 34 [Tripterygium wilfordii]|uniref:MLP-like protein 34 n=1 Tax=Tripterygium wilfordii TaxID=458696 RepID=UPI0018F8141C|nr:MLP-like protein 34 [Tripterygium wilfordii]
MATIEKLETEVKINSPAESFFQAYREKAHLIPKSARDNIHYVAAHEGDLKSHGSIKEWHYSTDGKIEALKGRIEVDEENLTITSVAMEGDVFKHYKSFKTILQVIPKDEGGLVKWTWEYEKSDENAPAPNKFITIAGNITKDIDSHIFPE